MTDTTNDLTTEEAEFHRMCVFSRTMAKKLQDHADLLLRNADECKCERESSWFREMRNHALYLRKIFIEEYAEYLN